MNTTKKTLSEQVNEVLASNKSVRAKALAIIKLGVTPYEAEYLARTKVVIPNTSSPFAYTFGVEMETINCNVESFERTANAKGLSFINHLGRYFGCHTDVPHFKLVPDGSIVGSQPAECVTPALKGESEGFNKLKACCDTLNTIGASVNKSCGLHVHIGAQMLTEKEYCNVFVNYMRLETAIDSFLAPSRRSGGAGAHWCHSLRHAENDIIAATTIGGIREALNRNRYHKVNAEAYLRHRTIEFRQHQGSINFTKIKAWVEFLAKLVAYSRTNRLARNIDRIEDIPFLNNAEKNYFISRRNTLAAL